MTYDLWLMRHCVELENRVDLLETQLQAGLRLLDSSVLLSRAHYDALLAAAADGLAARFEAGQ